MALLNHDVRGVARTLLRHDAVRFVGVGVWNTVFATVCFAVLFKLVFRGSYYMVALVVSTILSVTNSFVCHRWFTFRSDASIIKAYLRFYLVYGFQIGLTFVLMPVCVELLKWHPIAALVAVTFFTTVLTYFGHKHYSFQ